ncbi:Ras-related protein Rab-32 [Halotydeus destructor]|nr:Ras-related protein Rab-32 [Halotydeus destructor]
MDIESDLENENESAFYTAEQDADGQEEVAANELRDAREDTSQLENSSSGPSDFDFELGSTTRYGRSSSVPSDQSASQSAPDRLLASTSTSGHPNGHRNQRTVFKTCPLHGPAQSNLTNGSNRSKNTSKFEANGSTESRRQASASPMQVRRSPTPKEHLFKILVIGELATGKTSFIKRYVHQFFSDHYRATIGVDFALKVLNWDDSTLVRLQLWDIAGQERFGNMTRVYYKEAVGAFVVFDVSRPPTFDAVLKWKTDLDSKVSFPDGSSVPCVLLANKSDCSREGHAASPEYLDKFCSENGFAGWFYTSAKNNENVEEAAKYLVNKVLQAKRSFDSDDEDEDADVLELTTQKKSESNSYGGCSC